MSNITQTDELLTYCAHGLQCTFQNNTCKRWHVGGICFFSMCYEKPTGSGVCFKETCSSEHPEYLNNNIWKLKSGKTFYFMDPKFKPENDESVKAEILATKQIKADIKDTRKAARKAARKPASDKAWADINTEEIIQSGSRDIQIPENTTLQTPTMVNMDTKSSWAEMVKSAKPEPVAVKPEPVAVKPEPVSGENKYSSHLNKITREFLDDSFDPAQFDNLQISLTHEFAQITKQLQILHEQTSKLHKLRKAHAAYTSKDN